MRKSIMVGALLAGAFLLVSPAAHAKKHKLDNIQIRNCSGVKVKLCWFNGKDKAKLASKYSRTLDNDSGTTLSGKSNKKFAKLVALQSSKGCGEWDILTKGAFKHAKTGSKYVVKKGSRNKVKLHSTDNVNSCD